VIPPYVLALGVVTVIGWFLGPREKQEFLFVLSILMILDGLWRVQCDLADIRQRLSGRKALVTTTD
jgi:hypothetical protein